MFTFSNDENNGDHLDDLSDSPNFIDAFIVYHISSQFLPPPPSINKL